MSVVLVSAAAVALGGALLARHLRGRFDAAVTVATVALLTAGTFLLDAFIRPVSLAPAASFLLASVAVVMAGRAARGPGIACLLGLVCGAAAAVHAPNAALLALAWPRHREEARSSAVAALAAAVVVALASSAGWAAFALGRPHLLPTLFGSRGGLLFLTPVLWLGLAGLIIEARRGGRSARVLASSAVGLLILQALCAGPWPREALTGLLPLLAQGTGRALHGLRAVVRRAPAAPVWAALLALVFWNLAFMQQYASGMIPRDFPLPFAQVAGQAAGALARGVGAPGSWPANWAFALRHGVGPDRFDVAEGKDVPRDAEGAVVVDVGRLDLDEALLLEGWSVRHPCADAVCRAVDGRARLLLPVDGGPRLILRVRAGGRGWLRAGVGRTPARSLPLRPGLADLDFDLGRLAPGLHAVTLEVSPGGEALVDRVRALPVALEATR